jgi:hypothetical protein
MTREAFARTHPGSFHRANFAENQMKRPDFGQT